MGQSTSRPDSAGLQPTRPTTNAVAGARSDSQLDSAGNGEDSSRGTRRTSVRRSIFNLVKPNGARSRVSSLGSSMGEGRRSWRNSRLWSRPPQDHTNLGEPLTSSSSLTAGPSSASTSQRDKEKQPETVDSETEESQDRDLGDHQAVDRLSLSPTSDTMIQETLLDRTSMASPPTSPSSISESHETPASLPLESDPSSIETNPPATSSPPSPSPPTQPPSPPARQFPPPGTLVVVQGIVHTTDVSRTLPETPPPTQPQPTPTPGASELSLDPSTSRTRNRLSALLRPRSSSSRPSSAVLNEPVPSLTVTPPPEQDQVSEFQSSEELSRTRSTTPIVPEPTEAPPPLPEPPTDNRATSISSSSIDVLGTLLSVAAAATAASLLTGSSEPILSSGLAPPGSTAPTPPSPTHTTPTNFSPPSPLADISAAGRAERMRQAWSTIRERLGLRPSASPSPGDQLPGEPTPTPNPSESPATSAPPTDTRELMLAEMARAFNIGLGLNGLAGTQTSGSGEAGSTPTPSTTTSGATGEAPPVDAPGTDATAPSPPLPPEGSFERFLVDLQIDLRTALTRPEEEQPVEDRAPASEEDGDVASEIIPPFIPATSNQGSDDSEREVNQRRASVDDSNSIPGLQEVSDSDSEFDEEEDLDDTDGGEDDAEGHEDFHSTYTSNQGAPNPNPADRHSNFSGRIDASGRINWWRLYRFPPIMSPRVDLASLRQSLVPGGTPPAAAASSSSTTPLPASTPPQSTTPSSDTSSLSSSTTTPLSDSSTTINPASPSESSIPLPTPAPAPTTPHPLHAVVPVIVVGLQSVNHEWRPDGSTPPGDNEGIDIFGQPTTESQSPSPTDSNDPEDDFDGFGGQRQQGTSTNHPGGENTRGRARGWQHRAANAFRNLRPGRRPASAAQQPAAPPGSRTFLIYVIGGYYPPDHSIVTGGPNNLDSFEALLELADLLGQVKPSTVSKDEIEKSGLEIIKTEQLEQHEKDCKIASNCVDRCLICLDDYEPEQDLRVMSCKHTFHKACVDEWLQKGRNNCPACRTTGVNLDAPSTSAPVS